MPKRERNIRAIGKRRPIDITKLGLAVAQLAEDLNQPPAPADAKTPRDREGEQ